MRPLPSSIGVVEAVCQFLTAVPCVPVLLHVRARAAVALICGNLGPFFVDLGWPPESFRWAGCNGYPVPNCINSQCAGATNGAIVTASTIGTPEVLDLFATRSGLNGQFSVPEIFALSSSPRLSQDDD